MFVCFFRFGWIDLMGPRTKWRQKSKFDQIHWTLQQHEFLVPYENITGNCYIICIQKCLKNLWLVPPIYFTLWFQQEDPKEREKLVNKFIKIMRELRKHNNFNSYLALLSALDSAPIRRLEWCKSITEALKEHCALIDSSSSFRAYRQALSSAA